MPLNKITPPAICSLKNIKIKELLALKTARGRKQQKLFTIEGKKEIALALAGRYTLVRVFFCPTIAPDNTWISMGIPYQILIPVSKPVFEKIAYRKTTEGAVAVAEWKSHTLEKILLSKKPLIVIADSIEKPGNLGALIRTAEAADTDAILVCDSPIDLYNPNVIRSGTGYVFTQQVVMTNSKTALAWLAKNGIKIYTTSLQEGTHYRHVNYNQPCALVVGSESIGVGEDWKSSSIEKITIPMKGKVDSLNVSVSAAVIIFEALRQRGV